MIIETKRLILREFSYEDLPALYKILSDPEVMAHYPKPFDQAEVQAWIKRNLDRYRSDGFGLLAVVLKKSGELIGDCGLTLQNIDGSLLPEIGYHIDKKYWRQGYGSEAASAIRDWAFKTQHYDALYSYMKFTNTPSCNTARAIGMKKLREYPDPVNTISVVYGITRSEWNLLEKAAKKD